MRIQNRTIYGMVIFLQLFLKTGISDSIKVDLLKTIYIINQHGKKIQLHVELADTAEKRSLGLMNRKLLPGNHGMLFIFPKSLRVSFWMKNTLIPLDIAFIDGKRTILEIFQMSPLSTKVFDSSHPVVYALEVNQGFFKSNYIQPGARIYISTK